MMARSSFEIGQLWASFPKMIQPNKFLACPRLDSISQISEFVSSSCRIRPIICVLTDIRLAQCTVSKFVCCCLYKRGAGSEVEPHATPNKHDPWSSRRWYRTIVSILMLSLTGSQPSLKQQQRLLRYILQSPLRVIKETKSTTC